MIVHRVPGFVQKLYPGRIWNLRSTQPCVYLTFDDGPVSGVTDFVLAELEKRAMKATFFMVGDNVRRYPDLAREVSVAGHGIGNHTNHHLNGRKTDYKTYLHDVAACDRVLEDVAGVKTPLFRPPYGRLTFAQARAISSKKKLVMWEVLSGDFDSKLSDRRISKACLEQLSPGSLVLFHDQEKTADRLRRILPDYLDQLADRGWKTEIVQPFEYIAK